MTSIMQKISEDISSVVEYMASNSPEVRLQIEDRIYVLSLTVQDVVQDAE